MSEFSFNPHEDTKILLQPDDRGTVGGAAVLRVVRRGGEAVHYLTEALEEGATITQEVDWVRRHDHMQQHSGQHLITGELRLMALHTLE